MTSFRLPISPSHVATTVGLVLVQLMPHLHAEAKGIITGGVVAVYVVAEAIVSSIKAKKLAIPDELVRRIEELEAR
jgi:phage-related holin